MPCDWLVSASGWVMAGRVGGWVMASRGGLGDGCWYFYRSGLVIADRVGGLASAGDRMGGWVMSTGHVGI